MAIKLRLRQIKKEIKRMFYWVEFSPVDSVCLDGSVAKQIREGYDQ